MESEKHTEKLNLQFQRTDWWLQGQDIGRSKMGEGGQNIQRSTYKVSNPWKYNVQHVCYN